MLLDFVSMYSVYKDTKSQSSIDFELNTEELVVMVDSLWGDDFVVKPEPEVAKKVIKKIKEPKDPSKTVTRTVKSKSVSIHEKLALITENVKKILGVYAENTQVICSRAELTKYIDSAL